MAAIAAGSAFLGVERSVGGRRWRSRLDDDALALALAQALDVPELLARVLAARKVALDEAEAFLHPTLRALMPDPSGLRDMDRAAERVSDAVENQELIAIFGDYDVDGATASALLRLHLEALGARVRPYIPDRLSEGYGPSTAAMRLLAGEGASVAITVDCGTTANDALAAAAACGLDVIVVDHHLAGPDLPRCHALVNPNRLDDVSGLGALAAVGVAFMLAVAVNRELRARGRFAAAEAPDLKRWLDLVALGTVCDVVPLTGLNRAFVRHGLAVMARRSNVGLATLADVARLDQAPTAWHAGFVLGPRINAGGRVGKADLGHRLLTSRGAAEALPIAQTLDRLNQERKAIEAAVLAQALDRAEAQAAAGSPILVVAAEGWHAGVVGLVASRLVEAFHRPACVIALGDGIGKGSARSTADVDIGAMVTAARQAGLLVNGGGHRMAAGLTVTADKLDALTGFLQKRAADGAAPEAPSLGLDGALGVAGATVALCDLLADAGPFGSGNPEPRFALPDCRIAHADVVGDKHVRCRLAGAGGGTLKAIAFRTADAPVGQALLGARGGTLHVAGHLREDRWGGRVGVQLVVDDVARPA